MSRAACLLVLAGWAAQTQTQPNESHAGDYDIRVERAVKVNAGGATVYAVTAAFQFRNRDNVLVKDLGLVPARDSRYRYLASSAAIEFRDADSGRLIVSVPVEETVQVAGAPTLDFPRDTDFPEPFRTYPSAVSAVKLRDVVYQILQRSFQIEPRDEDRVTHVTTSYESLTIPNGPKNIVGKIALRISFPFEESGGQHHYRIQQAVREGRTASDEWRQPATPAVVAAADEFVRNLAQSVNAALR